MVCYVRDTCAARHELSLVLKYEHLALCAVTRQFVAFQGQLRYTRISGRAIRAIPPACFRVYVVPLKLDADDRFSLRTLNYFIFPTYLYA